ncbi:MFS transporter [Streptomyces sp. NPDC102381]|uniref:MFS transporter n=1 Tax=Streptomyces sp. NPDC102381 TaxID=3366164 RepID=UPI00380367E2
MADRAVDGEDAQDTGGAGGEPRRGIWTRDFGLFFTARGVAKLGDSMLPVALAAGLLQYGYGAGAVGLAMASSVACFAGLVIFGGVLADRFNTRLLMTGADLARLVTQSLAAVMFFTGHVVLWQICVIGAINGLAAAVFQPGVAGTVPRLASDVQAANGAIRVAESGAQLAGPAVAGMLVAVASPGLVFAAHAGTYGVSALCLLLLRLPPVPRDRAKTHTRGALRSLHSFRSELVEGWREFRSRRWLWGVILVWCVLMIGASGPAVPLVAVQVTQEHGSTAYGLVNSALGAGTVIGGVLALRVRPRRMLRAGGLALFGFALFPATVGAGLGVPWMMAGCAVAGAGSSFWGVMWATSVQTQVPREILNRIHAYEVAGSIAMQPVGQALAGPAAAAFGTHQVLLAGGVVTLMVATTLISVPAISGLVRADAQPSHLPFSTPVQRQRREVQRQRSQE